MLRALSSLLWLTLAASRLNPVAVASDFVSPCPNVFMYEPNATEPGKWYGVINLSTDTILHSLWLNVVLESKADILGNWVGEVTTDDNIDFKIENTKMKILPGQPLTVRFFIQYNTQNQLPPPKLQAIRFNGREICNDIVDSTTLQALESEFSAKTGITYRINRTTSTTIKPTTTTFAPLYWQQPKVENTQQVQSPYLIPSKTVNNYQDKKNNDVRPYTTTSKSLFYNYSISTTQETKYDDASNVTRRHLIGTHSGYNPQAKSEKNQPLALKPQYWAQKTQETTTTTTTLKPHIWYQVKPENNQHAASGNKVLSIPIDRSQTTTKVDNNQQIKSKDKQQIKLEIGPQTVTENKSQAIYQPWTQTKAENNQQKKSDCTNTKREEQTISNTRTENLSHVFHEVTTQSQQWDRYTVENNQQARPEGLQTKSDNKSQTAVKPINWQNVSLDDSEYYKTEKYVYNTRYWPEIPDEDNVEITSVKPIAPVTEHIIFETKFVIDDTSDAQNENSRNKYSDSSSFIRSESSQQIKSDDRTLGKPYDRYQTSPSDTRRDQDDPRENIPVYVRPEDRQTVTEVIFGSRPTENLQKKNKDTTKITLENSQQIRPVDSYQTKTEDSELNRDEEGLVRRPINIRGQNTEVRTSSWSTDRSESQTMDNVFESAGDLTRYSPDGTGDHVKTLDSSIPFSDIEATITTGAPRPNMEYLPDILDFDEYTTKKVEEVEYYFGGGPPIYVPHHGHRGTLPACGRVIKNELPVHSLKGSVTLEGQWPWQIALYQQQTTVDFKYICGGTLVSRQHVITAAHCVTRKGSRRVVNKNTLTVYLGKHNLRTSVDGVQVKFVGRIIIYPDYVAANFGKDLAILELREAVTYSDWVQPACLWPENEIDLKYIIGKKGSVVGWGFQSSGVAREELTLLEMPVVNRSTCLSSSPDFFKRFISEYAYCAGYRDGTVVCNGDSGGGMVFKKGNNWYLRGVASLSVARQGETYHCDPDHYVVFTDIAKFLPWIESNVDGY